MPAPIFHEHPVRTHRINAYEEDLDDLGRKVPSISIKLDVYGSEFDESQNSGKLDAFLMFVDTMAQSLVVDVMKGSRAETPPGRSPRQ